MTEGDAPARDAPSPRYLVFATRRELPDDFDLRNLDQRDPDAFEVVGVYPDHESAHRARRARAQAAGDGAPTRCFIVRLQSPAAPQGLRRRLGWGLPAKRGARGPIVPEALGFWFALYLGFVKWTNRFAREPADLGAVLMDNAPVIFALWHGQGFMIPFVRPEGMARVCALVSHHRDAEALASALRRLGVMPVRGSGNGTERWRRTGGARALLTLKRELDAGASVAMTADLPKVARVAGRGIVTLARLSGRPIVPTAVVTSRRFQFKSWDCASLGKPFGRGAMVLGDPVRVAPDADPAALETARLAVQAGLDDAHRRAYALVGAHDPGAGLRPA